LFRGFDYIFKGVQMSRFRVAFFTLFFALFFVGCTEEKNGYTIEHKPFVKKNIVFGIHPYLNPVDMQKAYYPIMEYLNSKIEGAEFFIEASNSYEHFEEKLFAELFDFALPNPYQTVLSLEHGYEVIAKMAPDDDFRGVFIKRKDSPIKEIKHINGKTISFPAKTALAATLMPLFYLHQNGIDTEKNIKKLFVGSQYSSILNAYTKDSDIAATWPPPWRKWQEENPEKAKDMELFAQTEPLPNNGVVAKKSIDKNLKQKVAFALVELKNTKEGRDILKNAGFEGFELADDTTYQPVVEFLEEYDKNIGLPR